jgi:hypothetical protein
MGAMFIIVDVEATFLACVDIFVICMRSIIIPLPSVHDSLIIAVKPKIE